MELTYENLENYLITLGKPSKRTEDEVEKLALKFLLENGIKVLGVANREFQPKWNDQLNIEEFVELRCDKTKSVNMVYFKAAGEYKTIDLGVDYEASNIHGYLLHAYTLILETYFKNQLGETY